MVENSPNVSTLRNIILEDIFRGIGASTGSWARKLLMPIVWPPAHKFAEFANRFEQKVAQSNMVEAMRQNLQQFVKDVYVRGADQIPHEGPLLIVSNHPGAFDEFVIASALPRSDLNIIASGFPFLQKLPATSRYLIYTNNELNARIKTVRTIIRRLKEGAALLIFPSGTVDPDPAVLPGAREALNNWSRSLDLILRKVPQTQVSVSIVSGVISPACLRHPFVRLFKDPNQRQKIAEGYQIMQHMFFPQKYGLVPTITYGNPLTPAELVSDETPEILQYLRFCSLSSREQNYY
jgi:1-acyl-sn-glycerol-3-phosphate acyltransferase